MTTHSTRTLFEIGRAPYRWVMSRPELVPAVVVTLRRHQVDRMARPGTGIVIDGYPRSANTFAVHAFRSVNPDVRIAHHLHCPGHLLRGVKLGLPVLLVVRSPADSVVSEVVRDSRRSLAGAVSDWVHFHSHLAGRIDGMVVSTFDETTGDLGSVIERLNVRFGTSFRPYAGGEDNDAAVMASIQRVTDEAWTGDDDRARRAPRPVAERAVRQERLAAELGSSRFTGQMETARGLYETSASNGRTAS